MTLNYTVYRDNNKTTPVYTTSGVSEFWNTPTLSFLDKSATVLKAGTTHTYQAVATDPSGNIASSATATVTIPANPSAYATQVLTDGASTYWRMDQAANSSSVIDWAGSSDAVAGAGVSGGTAGAVIGDSNTAATFNGTTSGTVSTPAKITGPNTFTVSAWFQTAAGYAQGGKIVGFGDAQTGNSGSYDRQVYMDDAGHIWFGVYPNTVATLNTSAAYNDGNWHQVVATLGPGGMTLSIDGLPVASRSDVTNGQAYTGNWRVGGDNLGGWPNQPDDLYFTGNIDDVSIYPTVLNRAQIRNQYAKANYPVTSVPGDAYGAAAFSADPDLFWRLDDNAGTTTAADSGPYANAGAVLGGVTFGQPGVGVVGATDTAAAFDGNGGSLASANAASNPATYTEQAWFNTTSTLGGLITGFGDSNSGSSNNHDRQVYVTNSGAVSFAVSGNAGPTVLSTDGGYNDGKWHQVVATQGPNGMNLYIDGTLRQTSTVTTSGNYGGYWRAGGDNVTGWTNSPSSGYLAGTLDEISVYPTELSASAVAAQYKAATGSVPDQPPTASFTFSRAGNTLTLNGTGSSDPDGHIAGYAWSFGDNGTATTATATHTFASPRGLRGDLEGHRQRWCVLHENPAGSGGRRLRHFCEL